MSLRLLQKQLGQESEDRQRQLGHAPARGRGRGSWLGSKPRGIGRTSTSSSNVNESIAEDAEEEPPVVGFYRGKGKGGKSAGRGSSSSGKSAGRGSSSFVSDLAGDDGDQEAARSEPQPSSASSTKGRAKGAQAAEVPVEPAVSASQDDATCVQGLADVLAASNLTRHAAAAEKWCQEWGAANLEEIAESIDDFAQGVPLKPLERKRFQKALDEATGGSAATLESAEAQAARAAALAAERARAAALEELTSAVAAGGDETRLAAALEAAAAAGVQEEECDEARALLEELQSTATAEVEGLTEVFETAKLPQKADFACDWARQQGLQTCEEVFARFDELTDHLRIKMLERKRLERAFDSHIKSAPSPAAAPSKPTEAVASTPASEQEEFPSLQRSTSTKPSDEKEKQKNTRLTAEKALKAAMDATKSSEGDVDELKQAMTNAEEAGVGKKILGEAKKSLAALEAALQEAAEAELRRQAGEDALHAAVTAAVDKGFAAVDDLRSAIQEAENASVSQPSLETARAQLAKLEQLAEEAAREAEREMAEEELEEAMNDVDVNQLGEAIARAEQMGVHTGQLEEAREKLKALQDAANEKAAAIATLQSEMTEGDDESLSKAIERAELHCGGSEVLVQAKEELERRKAKAKAEQDRREASEALQAAIDEDQIEDLREALQWAEEAGCDSALIEKAHADLAKREAAAQARAEAAAAVQAALKGSDLEPLRDALNKLTEVEGDSNLIEQASEELAKRKAAAQKAQERADAELMLQKAITDESIEQLQIALEKAENAGASKKLLSDARRFLDELQGKQQKAEQEQREATEALQSAMEAAVIEDLQEALQWAQEAGCDEALIAQARGELTRREKAKQKIEEALAGDAVGSTCIENLLMEVQNVKVDTTALEAEKAARSCGELELDKAAEQVGSPSLRKALDETSNLRINRDNAFGELSKREQAESAISQVLAGGKLGSAVLHEAIAQIDGINVCTKEIERELEKRLAAEVRLKDALDTLGSEALKASLQEVAGVNVDRENVNRELGVRQKAEQSIKAALDDDGTDELEKVLLEVEVDEISVDTQLAYDALHKRKLDLSQRKDAECIIAAAMQSDALGSAVLLEALSKVKDIAIDKSAIQAELDLRADAEITLKNALDALGSAVLLEALSKVKDIAIDKSAIQAELDLRTDAEITLKNALDDTMLGCAVLQQALHDVEEVSVEKGQVEVELAKRKEAEQVIAHALSSDQLGSAILEEALSKVNGIRIETTAIQTEYELRVAAEQRAATQRKEAAASLQAALKKGEVEPIKDAMQKLQEVGGDSALLERAKKELAKREAEAKKSQARAEAESTLQSAMADGDIEMLEGSLSPAEKAGANKKLIGEAKRALADLRGKQQKREEAEQKLIAAAGADAIDALQAAIDEAVAAGVRESALNDARASLESKQKVADVASQRKEAAATLQAALKKGEVEPIMDAMQKVQEVGGDSALLERAKKELAKREAAAQKAQARADAESALQSAMADEDVQRLEQALPQAEKCGVTKKVLTDAKRALTELQSRQRQRHKAEQRLIAAAAGEDLKAFQSAMDDAVALGVAEAILNEARAKWEPKKALEDALAADDLDRLLGAIVDAEEAGVEDSAIEKARQEADRRSADVEKQKAQLQAVEILKKAMAGDDVESLRQAISEAESMGVASDTLEEARKALQEFQEEEQRLQEQEAAKQAALRAREDAAMALKEAMQGDEIAALQEAMQSAKSAGVDEDLMAEAAAVAGEMEEAQGRAEAAAALGTAAAGSDCTVLKEAITRAESVGISGSTLERAKSSLSDLEASTVQAVTKAPPGLEPPSPQPKKRGKKKDGKAPQEGRSTSSPTEKDQKKKGPPEQLGDSALQAADPKEPSTPSRSVSGPLSLTDDEIQELLAELRDAAEARDGAALGPLLAKAEKAGVDPQELAVAKRVNFQLQKEKRENAKKDKNRKEAAQALAEAVAGGDMESLREALARGEEVGLTEGDLADAHWRLCELEDEEKKKLQQFALQDAEYAISQNDVEAATLALEEAVAEGADPSEVARVEKELAALRERLDPEGEARRRRLEKRRTKEVDKKWNFSGKSKNAPVVNDRVREHEEELEKRRMLAFKNRRFKHAAEDAGEEEAEREVRKARAEVNKEMGFVAAPKLAAAPQKGFHYLPATKEENEAPRKLTLKAHLEMGAGIDLHACWWGMTVDSIDDEPGQPGLRLLDTIVDVNGTSLQELEPDDCEQRFADLFGDGAVVTVEPQVQATGVITADAIDRGSLTGDLERFAADWAVEVRFEEISTNCLRVITEGPQSGVKAAKPELEGLMKFYAGV